MLGRAPMSDPADRPATEPRTEAGRDLLRRGAAFNGGKHKSITLRVDDWVPAILAIEAEAAQGAAPLTPDHNHEGGAHCFADCPAYTWQVRNSHGEWVTMPSEGAAPRAEGPCGECGHRATTHGCYQTECGCLGWAAPLDLDAIWEHVRVSHGCTHDIFRIGIVGNIPFEGAAPLGAVGAVLQEMDINEATLGTPVIYRSDLLAILEGAAPSEGAAPRAEGLPSVEALALAMAACGISDGDGDPMPDVAAAILTRLGAAPRAEGLDRKTLSMALHSLLPMDPGHWTVWQPNDFGGGKDVRANSAEFADLILARLSRPSDERVPESEEPRA